MLASNDSSQRVSTSRIREREKRWTTRLRLDYELSSLAESTSSVRPTKWRTSSRVSLFLHPHSIPIDLVNSRMPHLLDCTRFVISNHIEYWHAVATALLVGCSLVWTMLVKMPNVNRLLWASFHSAQVLFLSFFTYF